MFFSKPKLQHMNPYMEPTEPENPATSLDVLQSYGSEAWRRFNMGSGTINLGEAYQDYIDKAEKLTGKKLRNPEYYGVDADPEIRQKYWSDWNQYREDGGQLSGSVYRRMWQEREFRRQIDDFVKAHPDLKDQLTPPDQSFESQGRQKATDASEAAQETWMRSRQGWLDYAASTAGSFGGAMGDPINIMTMPFGFGGVGTGVKGIWTGFLKAGIANATVEGMVQPIVKGYNNQLGTPYGWGDVGISLGSAFLLGGGVDAAVRGTYRGLAGRFGYAPITNSDGYVVAWRRKVPSLGGTPSLEAELKPLSEIPTDLMQRAQQGDPAAIADIASRLTEAQKATGETVIPHTTMQQAAEGDMGSLRQVAEPEAKADPVVKMMLDAAEADERLLVAPDPKIPEADHAATMAQTLRHVDEPDLEPLPVRTETVDVAPEIVPKLEAEIKELRARAETPDADTQARIDELEAQIRQIDTFGRDPVQDAMMIREGAFQITNDVDLGNPGVRQARSLAALSDEAFAQVSKGEAAPELGALVADHAVPELHGRLLSDLTARQPVSLDDAKAQLVEILASPDYRPHVEDVQGPVAQSAKSPRQLDDPTGPEAKAQVQRLEQELREELAAGGREPPPMEEMLADPQAREVLISRADEVRSDVSGVVGRADQAVPTAKNVDPVSGEQLSDVDVEWVVDAWKFVRDQRRVKKPQSLYSWLIDKGGVKDDGKEVSAIFDKNRRIINGKNGKSLDDATLAAWQAGYLQGAERPDPKELLKALRREAHGDPVYRSEDADIIESKAIADEFANDLAELGLLNARSEQEIRSYFNAERGSDTRVAQEAERGAREGSAEPNVKADDEVRTAIAQMADIVPPGTEVRVFDSIDMLPTNIRASVRAANGKAFAAAVEAFQGAKSVAERHKARLALDAASRQQGVEGIAADGVIWIASYAMNPRARIAHEVVHALRTSGRLSPDEVRILATAARDLDVFHSDLEAMYRADLEGRVANVDAILEEEAAAHMIDAVVRGEVPAGRVVEPQVASVVDRIKEFFAKVRSALIGKGFVSPETVPVRRPEQDVIATLLSGEMAKREARADWMRDNVIKDWAQITESKVNGDGSVLLAMRHSDEKTGQSMRADLDRLGYFSGALEAAKRLRQAKGTPEQMLAMLQKEGAKKAEIEATGLDKLLAPAKTPDNEFWSAVKPLDAALEGEAKQAIDEWVGGDVGFADRGEFVGLFLADKLESLDDAALSAMAKPMRDELRARFGDYITVYRGERDQSGFTRAFKLYSYSSDRKVAESFTGARPSDVRVIQEAEIKAAEEKLAATGEASLDGYTFKKERQTVNGKSVEYIGLYSDRVGGFVTDTPGPRAFAEERNSFAKAENAKRKKALDGVREVRIPVDAVVWATDRFNQKEIIAKAGQEQPAQPSITKSEIIKYLEDNRVEVREKQYSRVKPMDVTQAEINTARSDARAMINETDDGFELFGQTYDTYAEAEDAADAAAGDALETSIRDETKWSPYSLDPNNPTYRETVLHLPDGDTRNAADASADALEEMTAEIEGRVPQFRTESPPPVFRSGHFPEPNIIGHMQTSLVKHEGKPTYLIDQIQSDWGQKLRDGGVRDEAKIAELKTKIANDETKFEEIVARGNAVLRDEKRRSLSELNALNSIREDWLTALMAKDLNIAGDAQNTFNRIKLAIAELRTAEAATPGHPLVNTTDQWTTTTLRRAIRQAVEADAEYIAIPHGDTVLSYNPGDADGMRGFYGSREIEGIVPKNLRKLLQKIDKSSPEPTRIDAVETTEGLKGWKDKTGVDLDQTGFTLFKLTDKVKQTVKEQGQPLFAMRGLDMSPEARKARAEEMGWHTDRDLWHGARRGFVGNAFRDSTQDNDVLGPAVYLTSHKSGAEHYADGGDVVGPFWVRGNIVGPDTEVPWKLNADGTAATKAPAKIVLGQLRGQLNSGRREAWGQGMSPAEYAREYMKRRGIDGYDSGGGHEIAIYDPSNIRSVNAAFDPSEAGSANLMFALRDLSRRLDAPLVDDLGKSDPHPGRVMAVHGTKAQPFDQFDPAMSADFGIHFGTRDQADIPAGYTTTRENARMIPVVLDLKTVVDVPDMMTWPPVEVAAAVEKAYPLARGLEDRVRAVIAAGSTETGPTGSVRPSREALAAGKAELRRLMTEAKIDGLRYWNDSEGEGWSYIVWDEGKVSSATSGEPMMGVRQVAREDAPQIIADAKAEMQAAAQKGVKLPDGTEVNGTPLFAIRAFHGSPHDFDKFSMEHIGKGEGAQAYGHGLYFAENEGVAKSYKELAKDRATFTTDPEIAKKVRSNNAEIARLTDDLERAATAFDEAEYNRISDAISKLEEESAVLQGHVGHMYEVNIKADPQDFLDWDKPLSQQSEKVRGAVQRALGEVPETLGKPSEWLSEATGTKNFVPTGAWAYETLMKKFMPPLPPDPPGTPKGWGYVQKGTEGMPASSRLLHEAGIPGIRYLDQMSRGAGEGSYNYVIFDDSLIEVVAKNGQPLTKGEPQFALRGNGEDIPARAAEQPEQPTGRIDPEVIARLTDAASSVAGDPAELAARLAPQIMETAQAYGISPDMVSGLAARVADQVGSGTDLTEALTRQLQDALPDQAQASQPLYGMMDAKGRVKPGAQKRAEDLATDLAEIEAELKGANIDEREALQRKRASLLNAIAADKVLDDARAYRTARGEEDPVKGLMHLIESEGVHGGAMDVVTLKNIIQGKALSMMDELVWEFRKGAFLGDWRRTMNTAVRTRMENVIREAAGEKTSDPLAASMGKAWLEVAEYLRKRFNAAGGDIGKLKGWFAPQYHDVDALVKAGRQVWVDYMMKDGVLDWERMTKADGSQLTVAERRDLLRDIWRTITTDGAEKREVTGFAGKGAMYKRHADHRVMHFKNADAYLKYTKEFGSGDVYAMMIGHINVMSRDIAAMERFGANPDVVLERVRQQLRIDAELAQTPRSMFDDLTDLVAEIKGFKSDAIKTRIDTTLTNLSKAYDKLDRIKRKSALRGSVSQQQAKLIAEIANAHMALNDLMVTGDMQPRALVLAERIVAMQDQMLETATRYSVKSKDPVERANTYLRRGEEMWKLYKGSTNVPGNSRAADAMQGFRNWTSASILVKASISAISDQAIGMAARAFIGMPVHKQLTSFIKGFTPADRKAALRLRVGLDQAMTAASVQSRYAGYVNTRSVTGYIADRTHAFSGLSPMTQAAKVGFSSDFMAWMADLAATTPYQKLDRWVQQMLARHQISADDWAALRTVTPDMDRGVAKLSGEAIERDVGEDLAEKYMAALFRERAMAVIDPTLRGRTAFISETKPGTVIGEMSRSVAMVKSFPTSYATLVLGRLYNQIASGRGMDTNSIAYGTAILFLGMAFGGLAIQLKDIANGADPQDMTEPDFWAKAFLQSGGAGIFGDFIASSVNRHGNGLATTLMGPLADRGSMVLDATVGNLVQYAKDEKTNTGREMARLMRSMTPGAFVPFYLRAAYERAVIDEIQKQIDPDSYRSFRSRIRSKKKFSGNEYFWPPGSPMPERGPRLDRAFGGDGMQ